MLSRHVRRRCRTRAIAVLIGAFGVAGACSADASKPAAWCSEALVVSEPRAGSYVRLLDANGAPTCALARVDARGVLRIAHVTDPLPDRLTRTTGPTGLVIWRDSGPIAYVEAPGGTYRIFGSGYSAASFATVLADLVVLQGTELTDFVASSPPSTADENGSIGPGR